jgi:carbon monoxide dehydrogenase subunit G
VAECLPGVELKAQDGDTYSGTITVKFGLTLVAFGGQADIKYRHDSESVSIDARGQDFRGSSRATAKVQVNARQEGGATAIDVTGDVDVLGPLAQFARTGGVFVTRQLLKDFAACLGAKAMAASATPAVATSRVSGDSASRSPAGDPAVTGAALDATSAESAFSAPVPNRPVSGFALLWQAFAMWVRERLGRRPRRWRGGTIR